MKMLFLCLLSGSICVADELPWWQQFQTGCGPDGVTNREQFVAFRKTVREILEKAGALTNAQRINQLAQREEYRGVLDAERRAMGLRSKQFWDTRHEVSDPVAAAIEIAEDQDCYFGLFSLRPGVAVLVEHMDDPRAVAELEKIASSGPHTEGEGEQTVYGKAATHLAKWKARKQYDAVLVGKTNPAERVKSILEFAEGHSNVLRNVQEYQDKITFYLDDLLAVDLKQYGGPETIPVVLRSGRTDVEYARKHLPGIVAYLQEIGPTNSHFGPSVYDALVGTGDKAILPILEGWFSVSTDWHDRWILERTINGMKASSP